MPLGDSHGCFRRPFERSALQDPHVGWQYKSAWWFQYREGDAVTFPIGDIVLGTIRGADRVNTAQLLSDVNGGIDHVRDPELTNSARFLQTLDQDGNVEDGVTIAPGVHEIVRGRKLDFAEISKGSEGEQKIRAFPEDSVVIKFRADLNAGGVFHR